LKRQHRLICAAINSGRINDLKKMTARAKDAPQTVVEPIVSAEADVPAEVEAASALPVEETFEIEYGPLTQEWTPPPKEETEEVEEVEAEPVVAEDAVAEDEEEAPVE